MSFGYGVTVCDSVIYDSSGKFEIIVQSRTPTTKKALPKSAVDASEGSSGAPVIKTRQRILIEASRLFSKQGYLGTSTREIADAVGVTQPGLYRHFKSKEDIVVALGEVILDPLIEMGESEKRRGRGSASELASYLSRLFHTVANSDYSSQFFISGNLPDTPKFKSLAEKYDVMETYLASLISRGTKSGEFRQVSGDICQQIIFSTANVLIFPASGNVDERINHILSFTLRGLLVDPSQEEAVLSPLNLQSPT